MFFRRISLFTLDWGDLEGGGQNEVDHRDGARPILESLSGFLNGVDVDKNLLRNGTDDRIKSLGPTRQWIENRDDRNWTSADEQLTSESNGTMVTARPFQADPKLPLCPMIPPGLHGTVKTITNDVPETLEELESVFPDLFPGGRFHPSECTSRHRVAIIVPYRDREDHLRTFLLNIHKFLRPQQLDYAIYLGKKNKQKLTNKPA